MTLPSDTLKKSTRRAPWIISLAAGVAVVAASAIVGPTLAANLTPEPTPTGTLSPYVSPPLTADELDSVQSAADAQQATIVADQAAQAAAEAQAAQDAANAAKAAHSSGAVKCPAGSTANSADGANDTSCLPTICFHLTLPDPDHPECDTAFKP